MARLLIIDDDASSLKTLTLVLSGRIPAEIETCASAVAALKRIATTDYAAVISDVKMPTLDGLSLLKEIRAKCPLTPVILTTAYDEQDVLVQAIRAGAYDFIRKPFDVDYLVASVARALAHYQATRDIEIKQQALVNRTAELEREVELRERHRLLVESVVDYGIFTLDVNGNINSWNIGAQRIKGYRAEEIIGRHFSVFYSPEDIAARKPEWELKTAIADGRIEDEGWRLRKDGSRFWANVVITALRDRKGVLRGFGKVTRDLTERKKSEDAKEMFLREQAARLTAEATNKAKDQFFATLSHELRSPLTPMLGWTRMLLTGNLDADTQARGLTIINRNVQVQAKLIEDILDVSRIIAGKLTLDIRSVNLVRVVENAVDVVRPSAGAKGIQIQTAFPEDSIELSGDGDRLQQVVWNLLTNAVKFTPNNGTVQIRIAPKESTIELVVTDTGVGMKPEFLPHVFERFSQADSSSVRVHGGLGIGLSLVKSLVELHGGTVRAESAGEGKGAMFTVTLPVHATGESEKKIDADPSQSMPSTKSELLHGSNLLVVDDEEDARDLIAFVLRQSGAKVKSAASVQEAIESFQKQKPDAIVSDLGMPVEDGFRLIARIREIESGTGNRTPAVALTAYAQDADRSRCIASGFQMHIPKPIDPEALVFAVSKLLAK